MTVIGIDSILHRSKVSGQILLLVWVLLLTLAQTLWGQPELDGWQLSSESKEMTIYTRKLDGEKYDEVRIIMRVRATPAQALKVLEDVAAYPSWVHRCASGRVLESKQGGTYFYTTMKLPFPVTNRDAISFAVNKTDAKTGTIIREAHATPDYLPIEKKMERIRKFTTVWKLKPLPDGWLEVDYRINSEPGGSAPAWLVNEIATLGPRKTLQGFANRLASAN